MPLPSQKKLGDSAELLKECESFEEDLAHLRATYEQYFLGIERRQPDAKHREVKNRINALRTAFVKSTAVRFRIQSLWTRYLSYERLWMRTLKEMEAGTYKRDLFRARLKQQRAKDAKPAAEAKPAAADDGFPNVDEVDQVSAAFSAAVNGEAQPKSGLSAALEAAAASKRKAPAVAPLVAPAVAPVAAPARAAAPPPTVKPAASSGGLSDDKVRAIYDAYVSAKKKNNEDVSKLSYDAVAQNLRKQVPELMKKHNAQSVEFKVVVKDGKTQLRAVPKTGR